jgi:hypothetical protein
VVQPSWLDELADLGGSRFRLLVLNPDQGRLVLAVVEKDLENAVGKQRDRNDRDEQRDIFGEKPASNARSWRLLRGHSARRGRSRERTSLRRIRVKGNGHRAPFLARRRRLVSCRNAAGQIR